MTVLYFGISRDRAGCASDEVPLETSVTLDQLWNILISRHEGLASVRAICQVAADMEILDSTSSIRAGAEVAIIPPVAGG